MKSKSFIVMSFALIAFTGMTGCATESRKLPVKVIVKSVSASKLTVAKVDAAIRTNEKSHEVSDIRIIGIKNTSGRGYAFASFELDGRPKYANIMTGSSYQGVGVGVFTASGTKGEPVQPLEYTQAIDTDGSTVLTGVVVDNRDVTNIIITFANGYVVKVPVVNGDFWFAGKVGSSLDDAGSKHAIGITRDGNLVINLT